MAPPSDPNLLYDTRHALDEFGVLDEAEAATFARLLLAERMDHGRLHAALGQAIQRFGALAEDEQDHFRDGLSRFVRTYSFLSQLVSFTDPALERDYLFGKGLLPFIRAEAGSAVDLSAVIELTHLRQEQQFAGSVALEATDGEVSTIYSGTGPQSNRTPSRCRSSSTGSTRGTARTGLTVTGSCWTRRPWNSSPTATCSWRR